MKKIGLLEIHYHVKFLYTMAEICNTKKTKVTIFTTKNIHSKLIPYLKKPSEFNFILKKENESINSFIKRVEYTCDKEIDILFINTIQKSILDFAHYFNFKPKCKMILTIHTINEWLQRKPAFDIKKILRSIDTNISSLFAKRILNKFDAINVIYKPMEEYIKKNNLYKKEIFILPSRFFDEKYSKKKIKEKEKISFVIPGRIEKHRRDYDLTLDVFEKVFKKYPKNLFLYILGTPVGVYGKKILNRCKTLEKKGFNIIYYNSYVPEKKYIETMEKSDCILLPISIKTEGIGVIPEFYGLTKGSAVFYEAMEYSKPGIAPSNFKILKEFKSSILKYKDFNEYKKHVENIIKDKNKLNKLKKEAANNSKNFSLKNLQKYFIKDILNKTNK